MEGPAERKVESRGYHWRALEVTTIALLKHVAQITTVDVQLDERREDLEKYAES